MASKKYGFLSKMKKMNIKNFGMERSNHGHNVIYLCLKHSIEVIPKKIKVKLHQFSYKEEFKEEVVVEQDNGLDQYVLMKVLNKVQCFHNQIGQKVKIIQ